jgi:hypothetical protein
MKMADSYLVKKIRWLEKLAEKAPKWDKYNTTSNGMGDELIDGIYEIVHEAAIEIMRKIDEEKKSEEEDE